MRLFAPIVALALLLPGAARAQLLPAGEFVEEALVVDLNGALFDFVVEELVAAVPPALVVGATPREEVADLWLCSQDYWLENLTIYTEFQVATIQRLPDRLNVLLDFDLAVNSSYSPTWIVLDGCLDDACALWVEAGRVRLELPITLQLATDSGGQPYVDVVFGQLQQDITAALLANLRLSSCALTEINSWFVDNVGQNLAQTMVQEALAEIDTTIAAELAEIEVQAEEALRAAWISGETELMDIPLGYELAPTRIEHSTEGVRLTLGGRVSADKHDCIGDLDPGGSLLTDTDVPPHWDDGWHLGLRLGDELPNQAGYGAWRSGLLCFEAAKLGENDLTASLLGLLLDDAFQVEIDRLFEDGDTPLLIRTQPTNPPVIRFDGPHDLVLAIDDLGIDFYVELLHRTSRLAGLSLDVEVGIDLSLADDGALSVRIDMEDAFTPGLAYDELSPVVGQVLLDDFDAIVALALENVVGDALPSELTVALPVFSGLGLADLYLEPDGAQLDFLSARFAAGPSSGGSSSGCDSEGGCAPAEGCDAAGEGCDAEEGCNLDAEGGCDAQALIVGLGCSGEPTDQPTDTGCSGEVIEAACGLGGRRIRVDRSTMLVLALVLVASRRRRGR